MVLRSEHPNSFDLFLKALAESNSILRDQVVDELHVVSVKQLIHDMVATSLPCAAQEERAQQHDEMSDETQVKTVVGSERSGGSERVLTRRNTRRDRAQWSSQRQEALEYVSHHRSSRGEIPLEDLPQANLSDAIRLEMQVAVTRRRSSAQALQGELAQRVLENINEALALLERAAPVVV